MCIKSILLLQKMTPFVARLLASWCPYNKATVCFWIREVRWANDGSKLNKQSGLWENQDGRLVLRVSLANLSFWFLHSFTHHSAAKMAQIMNRHRWGDIYQLVKTVYQQCLTCQVPNPGKTIFVPSGLRSPPPDPFTPATGLHSIAT